LSAFAKHFSIAEAAEKKQKEKEEAFDGDYMD
jgi:hypothetical protein